jgi:hypothetical protein
VTLPYDIARCRGLDLPLCQDCRRREPGREHWQTYISPAIKWIAGGERVCEFRIVKEKQ